MNCEYCVVATTLQTTDTCHVDSCLFRCYSFSVFPFDSVGNYACIKHNVFFSLTPRVLQILPCIVPFNLLYKHIGCQMKWINLLITLTHQCHYPTRVRSKGAHHRSEWCIFFLVGDCFPSKLLGRGAVNWYYIIQPLQWAKNLEMPSEKWWDETWAKTEK